MERLTREEAKELLEGQPVAHFGVVMEDGRPYVTPMSFVLDGDRILFRTMEGEKLEGIRSNPSVCIEVSTYDEETGDWASAIVTGEAEEVAGDAGLIVDPLSVDSIRAGLEAMLTDDVLHARLSAAAIPQASKFSWERAARETLAVFEEAIAVRREKIRMGLV